MDPVLPAPPPSAPPVAPLPEPKGKFLVLILAGAVLLGVGIVSGVFLGKQLYSKPAPQPTPSPVAETTPTPDLTANWKTYTNNYGNYEIKYPSNFSRMVCPNEENQIYLVQSGGTGEDPIIAPTCGRDSRYPIEIITSTDQITPNDDRYDVTTEVTSIAGIQAKKYISTQKPNFEGPGESWYIDVIFTRGGKYYDIYTHNKDFLTIFDQILSTFKFLDSSSNQNYTCPITDYVDCMPSIGTAKPQCDKAYLTWATANCPNFKGAAY